MEAQQVTEETTEPTAPEEPPSTPPEAQAPVDYSAALAVLEDPNANPLQLFINPALRNPLWRAAEMVAQTDFCPKMFRGETANCFIALQMAGRLRVDPLMLMQNFYVVHGKPAFETKLLVHLANERGPFAHDIRVRYEGEEGSDDFTAIAYAKYKDSDDFAESRVSMAMAKAEGWYTKNPKYRSMGRQMLSYRAMTFLVNLCCPGVKMGYSTVDEIRDVEVIPAPEGGAATRLEEAEDAVVEEVT